MPDIRRLPLDSVDPLGIGLLIGPDDPSVVAGGVNAPRGAPYIRETTGQWYTKFGPNPGDWAALAASSGFLPLTGGSLNAGASLTVPGTLSVGGGVTGASFTATGNVIAGAAARLGWTGRSQLYTIGDGVITVANNALTGFSRLNFGGDTAAFPAIRRNAASLEFVTADNANWAALNLHSLVTQVGGIVSATGITATTGAIQASAGAITSQSATEADLMMAKTGANARTSYFYNSGTVTGLFDTVLANNLWYFSFGASLALSTMIINAGVLSIGALLTAGIIQIGGATSAFPALRRSGALIEVVTADQTAFAQVNAFAFKTVGGTVGIDVPTGTAISTNTTNNTTSDFQQWTLLRGGVLKWRLGMNIIGGNVDEFNLYSDVSATYPIRITTAGIITLKGGVQLIGEDAAQVTLTSYSGGSSTSHWRGRIVAGGDVVRVVIGEVNNQAAVGAHNPALNAWANLYLNPGGNVIVGTDPGGSQVLRVGGGITATEFYDNVSGGRLGMIQVSTSAPPGSLPAGSVYVWVT